MARYDIKGKTVNLKQDWCDKSHDLFRANKIPYGTIETALCVIALMVEDYDYEAARQLSASILTHLRKNLKSEVKN